MYKQGRCKMDFRDKLTELDWLIIHEAMCYVNGAGIESDEFLKFMMERNGQTRPELKDHWDKCWSKGYNDIIGKVYGVLKQSGMTPQARSFWIKKFQTAYCLLRTSRYLQKKYALWEFICEVPSYAEADEDEQKRIYQWYLLWLGYGSPEGEPVLDKKNADVPSDTPEADASEWLDSLKVIEYAPGNRPMFDDIMNGKAVCHCPNCRNNVEELCEDLWHSFESDKGEVSTSLLKMWEMVKKNPRYNKYNDQMKNNAWIWFCRWLYAEKNVSARVIKELADKVIKKQ